MRAVPLWGGPFLFPYGGMTMKLPGFIKKIAAVCDTESSRYALGGILCEHSGKHSTVVATDGRKLVAVDYEDASGEAEQSFIVDGKSVCKAVTAVCTHKSERAVVSLVNGQVRVEGHKSLGDGGPNGNVATAAHIDGRFPRYKDVFGIYDEPLGNYACVKLDPAYIIQLAEIVKAAQSEASRGVYLWVNHSDPAKAVYMHMHGEEGELVRAVLMPLATDGDATTGACTEYPRPEFTGQETGPEPESYDDHPDRGNVEQDEPVVGGGPPECLDDDTIAAAVTAEPEPVGYGAFGSWIPPVS